MYMATLLNYPSNKIMQTGLTAAVAELYCGSVAYLMRGGATCNARPHGADKYFL